MKKMSVPGNQVVSVLEKQVKMSVFQQEQQQLDSSVRELVFAKNKRGSHSR